MCVPIAEEIQPDRIKSISIFNQIFIFTEFQYITTGNNDNIIYKYITVIQKGGRGKNTKNISLFGIIIF